MEEKKTGPFTQNVVFDADRKTKRRPEQDAFQRPRRGRALQTIRCAQQQVGCVMFHVYCCCACLYVPPSSSSWSSTGEPLAVCCTQQVVWCFIFASCTDSHVFLFFVLFLFFLFSVFFFVGEPPFSYTREQRLFVCDLKEGQQARRTASHRFALLDLMRDCHDRSTDGGMLFRRDANTTHPDANASFSTAVVTIRIFSSSNQTTG